MPTTRWIPTTSPTRCCRIRSVSSRRDDTTAHDPAGPGGANIDYTAADYNNPLSGPDAQQHRRSARPGSCPRFSARSSITIGPRRCPASRPTAPLLRKISFRPNPVDHPVFVQNTNPNFDAGSAAGPVRRRQSRRRHSRQYLDRSGPAGDYDPRRPHGKSSSPRAFSISTAGSTSTPTAAC